MAQPPRVFSIAPGADFLDTLALALLDGALVPGFSRADAPLGLAAATIYVPTRRAARALAAVLADRLGSVSALLPRIVPLGALDDTDLLFEDGGLDDAFAPDLPSAIGDIARRMVLTRLTLAWGQAVRHAFVSVDPAGTRSHAEEPLLVATSPADAWHLAGDLAALIDDMTIEGVAWTKMQPLGTDAFDRYWRITLDFLDIAMTQYPLILKGRDEVDGASRQVLLIAAEAARLSAGKSRGPVIVAGSTGSNKATGDLIAAVARLSQGAVVLPGLDLGLDDAAWEMVGRGGDAEPSVGHPQFSLYHLLKTIGIGRDGVLTLGGMTPAQAFRQKLVSEALRPAESTEAWRHIAGLDRIAALAGVTLVEAADEREEALAIAIALREALEGLGTAALVTPDREIARRVREELTRWGIDIEDSSGEPLGQTPAGALARLVLDCALKDLAPVEILALLHHPDLRLGRSRSDVTRLARSLENLILRGVVPPRVLQNPEALLAHARRLAAAPHASRDQKRLDEAALAAFAALLGDLLRALEPLRDLRADCSLPEWLAAHETVLAALLADEAGGLSSDAPGYAALASLFEELDAAADPAILLDCPGYAALFDRLTAETPVRGPHRTHRRIKILGLLEARLLRMDRIILGGLDEAVWPPQARTDPFLNRPMRAALGLTPPERRIGRTAHDFEMALGHSEIIITRALKRGGAPTVPSRFLQRLGAVAGERAWAACGARGAPVLAMARAIDRPARVEPVRRPAPCPPLELRPTNLSVTRIEVLRRDPYAIYAERILRLTPLDPIAASLGAREFGTAFHRAIADHARSWPPPDAPPGHAAEALLAGVGTTLDQAFEDAGFRAFQWPRIERWARSYLGWESTRRPELKTLLIEETGTLTIKLVDGTSFELRAVADRIEIDRSGRITVVDFKTGAAPSPREVKVGFAPQLTLEADMAARGAFAALGAIGEVDAAVYVKFGATEETKTVNLHWKDDPTFADVVANHRDELLGLLNAFRRIETGYMARPFPKYASRFGDYDHLSRVKEWSATGGADEGGGADE